MVADLGCGEMPSEAELQRACGTLYITHGLESTCGMVMFIFFSVVAIKLHIRSHLRSPAVAFIRFIFYHLYTFIDEFITTLQTVGQMDEMKLEVRLRFCGNLDKMANACSALLSLLGVTRWLSIGNVNGMRYIGYALTCPLTQIELVVMLAPIIPCYRLGAFFGFALCSASLSCAYAASLLEMPVWEGDLLKFFQTGNIEDWAPTTKFWVVCPGLCGISTLWLLILPYYCLMYTIKGGNSNKDLPQEYRFLVSLVWCTWICFPCWWFLSWEGNSVISDTKVNEVGFTVLNMLAKGLFTLQSFRVGELHEARCAEHRGPQRRSYGDGKPAMLKQQTTEGAFVPPIVSRASSRKLSESAFVRVLRDYDGDGSDDESSSYSEDDHDHGRLQQTARVDQRDDRAQLHSPRGRDRDDRGPAYSPGGRDRDDRAQPYTPGGRDRDDRAQPYTPGGRDRDDRAHSYSPRGRDHGKQRHSGRNRH